MEHIAFLPIGPEVVALLGAVVVLMIAVTLDLDRRSWGVVGAVALLVATVVLLHESSRPRAAESPP